MDSVKAWVAANYVEPMTSMQQSLHVPYVVFSFCVAFFLNGIKGTHPPCEVLPRLGLAMFRFQSLLPCLGTWLLFMYAS